MEKSSYIRRTNLEVTIQYAILSGKTFLEAHKKHEPPTNQELV